MKHKLLYLTSFLLTMALTFMGCSSDGDIAVTGVSLSQTSLTLAVGRTQVLKATVKPDNASNKKVSWTISNPAVASVSSMGNVTPLAPGAAIIFVTTEDGGKTDMCDLTVPISVESVMLDKAAITLTPDSSDILRAIVLPENATNKNLTWMSENPDIASVEEGLVTAKEVGAAVIRVASHDGAKMDMCRVTVEPSTVNIGVSGVTLNKTSATIEVGGGETLTAVVQPGNASNKSVLWHSNNHSVATVAGGVITAHAAGKATITVTTANGGYTDNCEVTVANVYIAGYEYTNGIPVAKLWVNGDAQTLSEGARGEAKSVYVSGSIAYVVGYINSQNLSVAKLWMNVNGQTNEQTLGSGNSNAKANFVFVSDNNIIYVAGYEENEQKKSVAKYWKGGAAQPLSNSAVDAEARSVFVSEGNVYVAGYETNASNMRIARLWINDQGGQTLGSESGNSEALSVYVSGGNYYAAGYQISSGGISIAKLWVNGAEIPLTTGTRNAVANAVYVSDNKMYVAGYENNDSGIPVAKIWIDGVSRNLCDGNNNSQAKSLHILDGSEFIAGNEYNSYGRVTGRCWKNNAMKIVGNGIDTAEANSIFVK